MAIGKGWTAWIAAAVMLAFSGAGLADDIPDYKNSALPFDKRVADLIKRMTLEEKVAELQVQSAGNLRLGIPAFNWWTEGLHGLTRIGGGPRGGMPFAGGPDAATIFPQAMGMAASWDPPMIYKIADAISDEARVRFDPGGSRGRGLTLWCPTVNLARDPRWGRTEETYGEDPYLAGRMGVSYVKGLQGDDPKYLKTVATPKHFAVYNQEDNRTASNANVSARTLREYYLAPFHDCFVEGKAQSVMTAFNAINGVPCSVNPWLITDVLRNEWGFTGAVVSDSRAVTDAYSAHRYVDSDEKAMAAAFNAGLDVVTDMQSKAAEIQAAVKSGLIKEDVIDRSLARNLMIRFRLGLFDPPDKVPYTHISTNVVGSKEHEAVSLQMAREGMVLLRNEPAPKGYGFERLLPLDMRRIHSIAVIGPFASVLQYGSYTGPAANPGPNIVNAIREQAGDRIEVLAHDYGDIDGSIKVAQEADVTIAVMGTGSGVERAGSDRYSLEMSTDQQIFLDRLLKAAPVTVLVLEAGSPLALERFKEKAPAILMAWYPGEQGGVAVAETLFGKSNPAGRLPVTFYRSVDDLPPMSDYEIQHGRTYMYLTKPASYAFGHGLSYTSFSYSNLRIESAGGVAADGTVAVSVDVANSGPVDGDEVVQLYVHKPQSAVYRPIKQLRGFQRITLRKGQTSTVKFALPVADLAYWDETAHGWKVEPGSYEIMIGAASDDIRLKGTVEVK